MAEFVNFEAAEDNVDGVINVDEDKEVYKNVSDGDFIDDENKFDENVENYYAFTNVSRSVEDAMQDSFIDFDYSQETNNYCPDDYDPSEEIIDEFKDSAKEVNDFKRTLLIPQGFQNIYSFYYAILYAIQNQLKNKKIECQDKLRYLIKLYFEKKTVLKELSSCIVEKFNGFNIFCVEFNKKVRQSFRPIDIIYKPVKKCDEITNCYFS